MAAVYVLAFFRLTADEEEKEEETGLAVIADVICITPSVSKQRKVDIHRSHFSEEGKAKAWLFRTTCSILTPNAVKPIINGICIYNQIMYIPICLFSRRALISEPSTVSKYIHHKLNAMLNPSPADIIEDTVQLWSAIPLTTPSIEIPKTIIVNEPRRSGKW